MNMEIFKDIKGYPGYQISNLGRVWNENTQHYLKASLKPNGYYQINLIAANGKRKKEYIHRLVALTFIDNPNNYPEVDHINRNRRDNDWRNLRWASRNTNARNTARNRKVAQYDKDGNLIKIHNSIAEAVERVNGSTSGIYSYFRLGHSYYKGYIFK